ncbi:hypothetical protein DNTS_014573 [Danionella cerebrum]|uniref:Uncharacterized protein n=1 Tax=Danionella cerebrum TaxID=2873325 RepID=A0A553QNC4_9TELE|nr:hypothetical protein DNTS_014573 [Danionella translucida]
MRMSKVAQNMLAIQNQRDRWKRNYRPAAPELGHAGVRRNLRPGQFFGQKSDAPDWIGIILPLL